MRKSTIDKIKGGENVEYTYKSAKKALLCFAAMTPAEEGGLLSEGKKRMLGRSRLWFKSPEKIRKMLSHAEKRFAPDPKDNPYVAEKKQKLLKELKDANNKYFEQKAKKYNDQIIK